MTEKEFLRLVRFKTVSIFVSKSLASPTELWGPDDANTFLYFTQGCEKLANRVLNCASYTAGQHYSFLRLPGGRIYCKNLNHVLSWRRFCSVFNGIYTTIVEAVPPYFAPQDERTPPHPSFYVSKKSYEEQAQSSGVQVTIGGKPAHVLRLTQMEEQAAFFNRRANILRLDVTKDNSPFYCDLLEEALPTERGRERFILSSHAGVVRAANYRLMRWETFYRSHMLEKPYELIVLFPAEERVSPAAEFNKLFQSLSDDILGISDEDKHGALRSALQRFKSAASQYVDTKQ